MNTKGLTVLGIDPGTNFSAYCVVNIDDYRILDKGKVDNDKMLEIVKTGYYDFLVIEGIVPYGMIGKETTDTIFLSGRLFQIAEDRASVITRTEVKKFYRVPHKDKATGKKVNADSYLRNMLIQRFTDKDWFSGVSNDTWQAYCLVCCWIDRLKLKQSATSV